MPAPRNEIVAWAPGLPGISEVLHARWHEHAYPSHTHDTWTLLIVDDGAIGYDLDQHRDHAALGSGVTLLPPHVPHDGHALSSRGFRKRVLYLDEELLPASLIGACVDAPSLHDPVLRRQVSRLDQALTSREHLDADAVLALVLERLTWHLAGRSTPPDTSPTARSRLAGAARDLLDADPAGITSITDVATTLGVSAAHLIRVFTSEYAIPPHRYLLGRRLDRARKLLLAGIPAARVAIDTGFYDQAHLTRTFRRFLQTTPGHYQHSTPVP